MILLIGQTAMTMMLLATAGIFLKSFLALTNVPLGFDPSGLVAMRTSVGAPRYATPEAIAIYTDELVARARAVPGVLQGAAASSSPLGSGPLTLLANAAEPWPATGTELRAILRSVTPAFFETTRIPVLRGREFTAADSGTSEPMAVINETAARRLFGTIDVVGHRVALRSGPRSAPWLPASRTVVVVGVAANIKEVGINEVEFADVYLPWSQSPSPSIELIVRTSAADAGIGPALKRAAAGVDPAVAVVSVTTFGQRVARVLQTDRFNLILVSTFAALALVLSIVGIYAAIAYLVEGRRREFGVRIALGARPIQLMSLALSQAGRIGIAGALIGLAGTLALSRAIGDALYLVPGSHQGMLYGVTTTDPWMLGAACALIVSVAIAAGLKPARNAGRVDPMVVLRQE